MCGVMLHLALRVVSFKACVNANQWAKCVVPSRDARPGCSMWQVSANTDMEVAIFLRDITSAWWKVKAGRFLGLVRLAQQDLCCQQHRCLLSRCFLPPNWARPGGLTPSQDMLMSQLKKIQRYQETECKTFFFSLYFVCWLAVSYGSISTSVFLLQSLIGLRFFVTPLFGLLTEIYWISNFFI